MNNSEVTIAILSAILGSSVLTTILSFLFQWIMRKADKHDAKDEALRLLLVDKIIENGKSYVKHKSIDRLEWKVFDAQYKSYKTLGGDGYADKIYKAVEQLLPEDLMEDIENEN